MQKKSDTKRSGVQKVFNILFAVLLLEIFLQISDLAVFRSQFTPKAGARSAGEKVILCVGDSTTAVGLDGAYPNLLQKKLNQLYGKGKYRVINAGVPGITSAGILATLNEQIKRYRPNYIITLIGVNDVLLYDGKTPLFKNLKIYSFLKTIREKYFDKQTHFDFDINSEFYSNNLIKDLKTSEIEAEAESAYQRQDYELAEELYKSLPAGHKPSEAMLWNMAIISSLAGRKDEARKFFGQLIEIRDDVKVNYSVAWYYTSHYPPPSPETEYALKLATRALELEPDNVRTLHFVGQIYKNELKQLSEAEFFYNKANGLSECNLGVTIGLSDLLEKQKKYREAIEVLNKCSDSDEIGVYELLARLIRLYRKENLMDEAKKTVLAAKSRFPDYPMFSLLEKDLLGTTTENVSWDFLQNEATVKNYRTIAQIINENKIKHIAMQYPLRDINLLKSALNSDAGITFVGNEDNYKNALASHDYNEIFLDKVTDEFGHSTKLGNQILVDRLVETLQAEKVLPN